MIFKSNIQELNLTYQLPQVYKAEHYITCDFCHASPTLGFRYKCLQCMNYNLCQTCFLRGSYNKGHKEGHFVQEFCLPATVWQETKATFNTMKNKLPFGKCPNKAYLSFDDESICDSSEVFLNPSTEKSAIRNCSLRKSTSAYLIKELSSIISQLEEETKQVADAESNKENGALKQINSLKTPSRNLPKKEHFQKPDSNFEAQLERLKEIVKALKTPHTMKKDTGVVSPVLHIPFHRKDSFFESTPMNSAAVPLQSKENLCDFSPHSVGSTRVLPKQQYNQSSDYSSQSFSSDKENFAFSSSYNSSKNVTDNISLELTALLNKSSRCLSTKLTDMNGCSNKLNSLSGSSSLDLEELKLSTLSGLDLPVSPKKHLRQYSKFAQSTFTLNKDGSLEIMEQELQAMIQHLEDLLPQVSVFANDSRIEKEKVVNALSEMEDAVQKLSHLSFEMSTGSTDL